MNRLFAAWMRGAGRLAFWRKTTASVSDQPENSAHEGHQSLAADGDGSSVVADISTPHQNWLARLTLAWHKRRTAAASASRDAGETAAPNQTGPAETPPREADNASAHSEPLPASGPSLLARLKALFRRRPGMVTDESTAAAEHGGAMLDSGNVEAVPETEARGMAGVLTNPGVWILAAGGITLAIVGAMLFMLVASGQEKRALQAELQETKKRLEERSSSAKKTVSNSVAAHAQAGESVLQQAGVAEQTTGVGAVASARPEEQSKMDAGECVVTDQASVAQNLKNCIESFNRISGDSASR